MAGTKWSAPGKGATVGEINAVAHNRLNYAPKAHQKIAQSIVWKLGKYPQDARTNLELTGERIQLYDLRRMLEAE